MPRSGLDQQVLLHPVAQGEFVDAADLRGQRWITGPPSGEDGLMGVWPGLDERPEIAHVARDRLGELHLVAAGFGPVPAVLIAAAPPGVRILPVRGGPQEQRRLRVARLLQPPTQPVTRVAAVLRATALQIDAPDPSSPHP